MTEEDFAKEEEDIEKCYGKWPFIAKGAITSIKGDKVTARLKNKKSKKNEIQNINFHLDYTSSLAFTEEDLQYLKAHNDLVPLWMEGKKRDISAFRAATRKHVRTRQPIPAKIEKDNEA